MTRPAYYNEIDPFAAQTLRNLIKAGYIAPGDVDERSILDVCPDDLRGYAQCHFFAGVGVWSYALRRAGWPDDREIWTGSCPCQPFSVAGVGGGFDDQRHLWPFFYHLIEQRRPPVVFGEQVASKDGYAWLDVVYADVEAMGYAFAPVVLPAAGFGAPHPRHRIFFVADSRGERVRAEGPGQALSAQGSHQGEGQERQRLRHDLGEHGATGGLEYAHSAVQDGRPPSGEQPLRDERGASSSGMGNPDEPGSQGWRLRFDGRAGERPLGADGAVGGFWSDADWIYCHGLGDIPPSYRPVEPGSFPLAPGIVARMDKVRAYGNAINAEVAREFIEAFVSSQRQYVKSEEPNG